MKSIDNKSEFEIIAKASTSEFLKIEAGYHVGRCIGIFSLGRQASTFADITSWRDEIVLEFELPNSCYYWDEDEKKQVWGTGKNSKPYTMRSIYSLSLSEKANLRKDLESWMNKSFTGKNPTFNIATLIGKPVYLVVRDKINAKGEAVPRISSMLPLPEGLQCPPQILESQVLTFQKWDQKVYANLGKWLREKIAQSNDFKTLVKAGVAQEVIDEVGR